jgi:hypothetical protein
VAPFRVFCAATVVAVYLQLWPIVSDRTTGVALAWWETVFATLRATIQAFTADSDLGAALVAFRDASDALTRVQSLYTAILYALAPLLTVGFVLSFFQTFSAHTRYQLHRRREANLFSELNDRSIALATSLRAHDRKAVIGFAGVVLARDEPSSELIGRARGLGAICFKEDVLAPALRRHAKGKTLRFFVIGDDEVENTRHAVGLATDPALRDRDHTDLYVFSGGVESALALRHRPGRIHVRRINPARTLVYDWLWRDRGDRPAGIDLFDHAVADGSDRVVAAVVVGLGEHGTEMVKALSWYGQMNFDGGSYRLQVDAFDADPAAAERFAAACPGLAEPSPQGDAVSRGPRQDALYDIKVRGGVDATGPALAAALAAIDPVTFVFVSVGDDSKNLQVAADLRRHFAREGRCPQILAVSRNAAVMRRALAAEAERLPAGVPRIELVGDVADVYSRETVVQSELEHNGLVCHMAWAQREAVKWRRYMDTFWEDDYCYASSITVPIHWKARRALDIPGARTPSAERTREEQDILRRLEHARWNAFMRSEGFLYGQKKDLEVAKTHPLLLPYDKLDPSQRDKDDNDSRDALPRLEEDLRRLKEEAGAKGGADGAFIRELEAFIATARPDVFGPEPASG